MSQRPLPPPDPSINLDDPNIRLGVQELRVLAHLGMRHRAEVGNQYDRSQEVCTLIRTWRGELRREGASEHLINFVTAAAEVFVHATWERNALMAAAVLSYLDNVGEPAAIADIEEVVSVLIARVQRLDAFVRAEPGFTRAETNELTHHVNNAAMGAASLVGSAIKSVKSRCSD